MASFRTSAMSFNVFSCEILGTIQPGQPDLPAAQGDIVGIPARLKDTKTYKNPTSSDIDAESSCSCYLTHTPTHIQQIHSKNEKTSLTRIRVRTVEMLRTLVAESGFPGLLLWPDT